MSTHDKRRRALSFHGEASVSTSKSLLTSSCTNISRPSLLDLPSEVLIHILRYLTSRDLLRLFETCHRLSNVSADWRLWIQVDILKDDLIIREDLLKMCKLLNARTKRVRIRGCRESLPSEFLRSMAERCPDLEMLTLDECVLDASDINISLFPTSIKTLCMTNCEMVNEPEDDPEQLQVSFFRGLYRHMHQLKSLDVSGSEWLRNGPLLDLTMGDLESLKFRGCNQFNGALVGVLKTREVDARDLKEGGSTWPMLGYLKGATHLYLGYTSAESLQAEGVEEPFKDQDLQCFLGFHHIVHDGGSSCLKHLTLTRTEVTDEGMFMLASLPLLKQLDVTGTRVTKEGMEVFLALKPECTVIWCQNQFII